MSADDLPDWIRRAFSVPRLNPYLTESGQVADKAVELYWWNIEVSAAFYGPLHCLEIALRNALHDQLCRRFGRPDWWASASVPLTDHGIRLVTEATLKCRRRGLTPPSADDVVAELSFGFWVSLLSNRRGSSYDRLLWVPTLHLAFPHHSGRRDELHTAFETMRLLRNRIMHYEPIHHRDLAADRRKLYYLLSAMDPVLAKEIRGLDRVETILARRRDAHSRVARPDL
ncbi:hypothetical protein ACPXB5_14655 [Micromonospora arida]|uniref:CAAX protease n=1 Tax=Micromonospora arida TaxID=2203715 RepID=A0A3N9XWH9_9ACTN|nr:hypothetical protein [Micromonospora arida]RQX11247.1 hypothetical protein DLJ58_08915 [Micromonospora arida]